MRTAQLGCAGAGGGRAQGSRNGGPQHSVQSRGRARATRLGGCVVRGSLCRITAAVTHPRGDEKPTIYSSGSSPHRTKNLLHRRPWGAVMSEPDGIPSLGSCLSSVTATQASQIPTAMDETLHIILHLLLAAVFLQGLLIVSDRNSIKLTPA